MIAKITQGIIHSLSRLTHSTAQIAWNEGRAINPPSLVVGLR
ncbi:hypothetical protein LDG_7860 [Legionella drancourtii LLAP12]|uniref:Uncharacterized protein n=1 Tax=Legionella drancourtii LLAP12 TaxID=658187 RepID=G9ERE6_9GAMM|nr:hypothetical protein LDG_7860 [Legionella drancourtii LLAP12]